MMKFQCLIYRFVYILTDLDILPEQMTSHTAPPVFGDKLLLWCGDKNDRRFVIMDTETGSIQNDIPSPGPRVLCAVIVGQRIWLGTEVRVEHCH